MAELLSSRPEGAGGRRAGLRRLEVAAWCTGAALLVVFAGARLDAALGRRAALRDFEAARGSGAAGAGSVHGLAEFESPDQALWSSQRVDGFRQSLAHDFAPPLAVLRVPKIDLEVPVLEGTDELALNRGVGHIASTPRPGEPGNVGIAGHRDGFFRGLKDVSAGDAIEIETLRGRRRYTIEAISIVSPERIDVLAPTAAATLTLVTCYPFYFVGNAPQRFIVRATLDGPAAVHSAERRGHAP